MVHSPDPNGSTERGKSPDADHADAVELLLPKGTNLLSTLACGGDVARRHLGDHPNSMPVINKGFRKFIIKLRVSPFLGCEAINEDEDLHTDDGIYIFTTVTINLEPEPTRPENSVLRNRQALRDFFCRILCMVCRIFAAQTSTS